MKRNKLFSLALSSLFAFGIAGGATNFSNSADFSHKTHNHPTHKHASLGADDFSDAVELGRDEIRVDLQSVTSTPASKSATIVFNSSRLTGLGTSKKNVFIVIDDEDYSGTNSNPSLSGATNPAFSGYTIEMENIATFTLRYETAGQTVSWLDLVIPEQLTYGDSFSVLNTKIVKDAFIFPESIDQDIADDYAEIDQELSEGKIEADEVEEEKEKALHKHLKFDYLVIPDGIETIESGAFKNIPTNLKGIRCEAPSKPAGWADDWCDALPTQIEWGYKLVDESVTGKKTGNETNHLSQTTGTNERFYGDLVKSASNSTNSLFSIVNDVNWTGNFDAPVRTSAGLTTPYHLESYVAYLEDVPSNANIVIPEKLTYGSDLVLENKTIAKDTLEFTNYVANNPEDPDELTYNGNIKSITIPAGIETVEANAFSEVPDSVTIYCEADSKPGLWADNWTDAKNVVWGHTVSDADKIDTVASTEREFRLGNDATTYILGYKHQTGANIIYQCDNCGKYFTGAHPSDKVCTFCNEKTTFTQSTLPDKRPAMEVPLVIYYEVKNTDNNTIREVWHEMPLVSEEPTSNSTSHFDSVKTSAHSRTLDILIDENEQLVEDSFRIHNIYRSKTTKILTQTVDNGEIVEKYASYIIPDTSVGFYASVEKRYDHEIDITEVINYKFNGLTKFGDHFMTSMSVDKVTPSYWYTGIGEQIKNETAMFLDDGTYSIRYAFYNLGNSFYRITYYSPTEGKEVETVIPIRTPNSVCVLEKNSGNNVSFLLKNSEIYYENSNGEKVYDFKQDNLKHFEILGLTINIHLWNNDTSNKVGRTDLVIRFGAVDVMPYDASGGSFYSIDLFILIFILIYSVVYAGVAVGLYFYLKEKFKNDEFRRMNGKRYLKTAILGYFGLLIICLALIFIGFRFTRFNNAVSVHNPLDAFIVIPGIISIVVIGYFVKFMVVKIKANKERKNAKKLKLNEDVLDDGTH